MKEMHTRLVTRPKFSKPARRLTSTFKKDYLSLNNIIPVDYALKPIMLTETTHLGATISKKKKEKKKKKKEKKKEKKKANNDNPLIITFG